MTKEFTGKFSCVYCGQDVDYSVEKKKLICSNPECPEGKASYGFNPLGNCVWAEQVPNHAWLSVSKTYILRHKGKFGI